MRIVVAGAGAVGGFLGAMLARAGIDVAFLARGANREALRARGLDVRSDTVPFHTGPLEAEPDPAALRRADAIFLAVKSWQVEALAPRLAPLVGEATIVVPLQNGVEAPDALARALAPRAVVGGVAHVLCWQEAPGVVAHRGAPLHVTVGERGGGPSPRLEALAAVLEGAGLGATVAENVLERMWEKLLFVESMGAVGAAARSPIGETRALRETRALLAEAMAETRAVANARGVAVAEAAIERAFARVDALPASSTTSMQRDLAEGRPSELEEQTGAVVRLGAAAGVPIPVHRALYALLEPQERRARLAGP